MLLCFLVKCLLEFHVVVPYSFKVGLSVREVNSCWLVIVSKAPFKYR